MCLIRARDFTARFREAILIECWSGFQAFGEELELADRVLQLVEGYGSRAVLDGPLAVIQLQPNNGLNGGRNLRLRRQQTPPGRSHEGLQTQGPRSQACRREGDGRGNKRA